MPFSEILANQGPVFGHLAAYSLPLLVLSSFAAIGFTIQSGKQKAKALKRSSFDKGAKQLALAASFLGWILVLTSKLALVFSFGSWVPVDLAGYYLEFLWIFLTGAVLALNIHYVAWKPLSQHPSLGTVLCLISAILGVGCVALYFGLGRFLITPHPLPNLFQANFLAIVQKTLLTTDLIFALIALLPLLLALTGVFGSLTFLFLRNRQDFGRDHYNIVLNWSTSLARNYGCVLVLLGLCSLGFAGITALEEPRPLATFFAHNLVTIVFTVLWILASLLYALVSRSSIPMRYSFVLLVAAIPSLLSLFCLLTTWLGSETVSKISLMLLFDR